MEQSVEKAEENVTIVKYVWSIQKTMYKLQKQESVTIIRHGIGIPRNVKNLLFPSVFVIIVPDNGT